MFPNMLLPPFLPGLQWSQTCPQSQTTKHSSSSSPPLLGRFFSHSSAPPDGRDWAPRCCPGHKHITKRLFKKKEKSEAKKVKHLVMDETRTSSNFLASCRRFRQYLIQHLAMSALCCLSFSLRSLSVSPALGSQIKGCQAMNDRQKCV